MCSGRRGNVHLAQKRNTDRLHFEKSSGRGLKHREPGITVSGDKVLTPANRNDKPASYTRRIRRSSPRSAEQHDRVKSSGSSDSGGSLERSASVAVRRFTRSELRWNSEDRRTASSRQDDLKLTSSTFALAGDSAHNQAMVHWSGQNSSVSPHNAIRYRRFGRAQ
ncbi:hypothetical protein AAFF_G00380230 [Aldrovandia affinis]|uniref:Uncharacterized protein n=1 Tax=Aldrovandia affinis TaxID=143900 RepID=A0AAD7T9G1_9TELE|nr:hypothetical protein AAFF_G00380230 [Aldrovandia affinis]